MSGDDGFADYPAAPTSASMDSSGRLWEGTALPPLVARDLMSSNAATPTAPKITIAVYLDDGQVFEYEVSSLSSAREHSAAIVQGGYRSTPANEPNVLTHYPPHRIKKVKVTSDHAILTNYHDRTRGT